MAITTYAELQAAAASWAHRSDLTTVIVDCITLCEARLADMLVLRNMESDEPLTLVVAQNYIALPTGYTSPIAFWLVVDSQRIVLDPALPQELQYATSSSQPRYWAIDGVNIRFDCPASSAYTAYLRCIKKAALATGDVAALALLVKRPDVYLYGTLVEVARYTRKPELVEQWEQKFQQAVAGLKASDNRGRAIVHLRSDIVPSTQRGNIFRGE